MYIDSSNDDIRASWIVRRIERFLTGRSTTSTTLSNGSRCTTMWTRTTSRTRTVSSGSTKLGTNVRHVADRGYNGQKMTTPTSSPPTMKTRRTTSRLVQEGRTDLGQSGKPIILFLYVKLHNNTLGVLGPTLGVIYCS